MRRNRFGKYKYKMRCLNFVFSFIIFNTANGQSIEIDTLNQDFRDYGYARVSYDTIIKKYPSVDNIEYPDWAKV